MTRFDVMAEEEDEGSTVGTAERVGCEEERGHSHDAWPAPEDGLHHRDRSLRIHTPQRTDKATTLAASVLNLPTSQKRSWRGWVQIFARVLAVTMDRASTVRRAPPMSARNPQIHHGFATYILKMGSFSCNIGNDCVPRFWQTFPTLPASADAPASRAPRDTEALPNHSARQIETRCCP